MNLNTITTNTHTITASYTTNGSGNIPVETNGETLQEIVNDLVEFFNDGDDSNNDYEVNSTLTNEYGEIKIIIEGTDTWDNPNHDFAPELCVVKICVEAVNNTDEI